MPKKDGYGWDDPLNPPPIEKHSKTKHEVIKSYIKRYIEILTAMPQKDLLRLYIIDGFAGGGFYKDEDNDNKLVVGSPILLYETIRKMEYQVNLSRTKKLKIDDHYFFIEKDKKTINCLEYSLKQKNISSPNIHILNEDFVVALPKVINHIKNYKRQRKPRCIFILDQYGYKDVPLNYLNQIFVEFPESAEVVLTFSTDTIVNYLSEDEKFKTAMKRVGLEDIFTDDQIIQYKESANARLLIEQQIYDQVACKCGAKFFTPFFIKSKKSRRSYWLIHLSNHPKARDEMCKIHWSLENHFVHHGDPGLNSVGIGLEKSLHMILGYSDAHSDQEMQGSFEFIFDDNAEKRTKVALSAQIPGLLNHNKPISFGELIVRTCNGTPANTDHYKAVIYELFKNKEITLVNKQGNLARIRSPSGISDEMGILIPKQIGLF